MKHTEMVPAPALPRDEVLSDPAHCHLSADGDHLLCYDAAMMSGAIYHRMTRTWLVHSGIGPAAWLAALVAADLRPQSVSQADFEALARESARGVPDGRRH